MIFAPENGYKTRRKERKLWVTFLVGSALNAWGKVVLSVITEV